MRTIAIVRKPSPRSAECELTFMSRAAIDYETLLTQHEAYTDRLRARNIEVEFLAELPEAPDGAFVEDPAIVLDELAILTRPGAASRIQEVASLREVLHRHRKVVHQILAPGTLEGGDVLRVGKNLFVGRSTRTNTDGIHQLRKLTAPFGYEVHPVEMKGCLHLKTGLSYLGNDTYLINKEWISFDRGNLIEVEPGEPFAANVLRTDEMILAPEEHPYTVAKLRAAGFAVETTPIGEFAKAEAGVTCLSLVFRAQ
jgi:dimethylargininase